MIKLSKKTFQPHQSSEPKKKIFFENKLLNNSSFTQAKLSINPPNDTYEQEADSISEQVMKMPINKNENTFFKPVSISSVRANTNLNRKCAECEEEEKIQRKEDSPGEAEAGHKLESFIGGLNSGGDPLPDSSKSFFGPRFGYDFSNVKVHTNPEANQSAQSINALAYTSGNNIVFNQNQYSPGTDKGKKLLAHELTHVVQQNSGIHPKRIQRAPTEESVKAEMKTWADKQTPPKSIDPNNPDFAYTAQEYAFSITHGGDFMPLPKPKDAAALKLWKEKFMKAGIISGLIMSAGPKVNDKEPRAAVIVNELAELGFADEAFLRSSLFSKDKREFVFGEIINNLSGLSPASLKEISTFYIKEYSKEDNPVLQNLTDHNGKLAVQLTSDQFIALFEPLLAAYPTDPLIVEALAQSLIFKPTLREKFSEWMWKAGTGDPELLFKVLESKYFIEPGYGPTVIRGTPELTMEGDMKWVYRNKQKYYVQYLVNLGTETGVSIPAPADLKFATLRSWLDTNTEKISEAALKKYPKDPGKIGEMYEQITDIFFFHVDRGNVNPDLGGKLAGLPADAPGLMRLKADCDVLATYAMRFLKPAGYEPIGYLLLDPRPPEVGHAVALLRNTSQYYVINNKEIIATGITEDAGKANSKKEDAISNARKSALSVYTTVPAAFKIYYGDSEPSGAMKTALYNLDASFERTDLGK